MPNALITGITGQDGAYLARFLLGKGYRVYGTVRCDAPDSTNSLRALDVSERVQLIPANFANSASLSHTLEQAAPAEIYHLAAQSSVALSWQQPVTTGEITGIGTARLLQAWREVCPAARFFQASSAEMYGRATVSPQTETTPFQPQSPYGVAKVYAHWMTVGYREAHAAHASCGILFNHESPLRPEAFVTRKVTLAAARIKHGLQSELVLGNLETQRDWGFAGDYVEAMWRILQHEQADDYVIATGQSHSLREFVALAFAGVGLNYQDYVRTNAALLRPVEAIAQVGNPHKIATRLGWAPRVHFEQLVTLLVEADIKRLLNQEAAICYTPEA